MASPDTLIASHAVARGRRPPCAYVNASQLRCAEPRHGSRDFALSFSGYVCYGSRLTVARANSLTIHGFAGIQNC